MHRHVLRNFLVFCVSWSTTCGTSQGIYETTTGLEVQLPTGRYDETTSCPEIKLPSVLEVKHDASVSYEREYFEGVDMDFVNEVGEHRYLNGTKAYLCCAIDGGCYFSTSDNGPSTALCVEGKWTRAFRQCPLKEDNDTDTHEKRRLSTSVAERLERFYDSANPAEKTFLQRVVAHMHSHFAESNEV